MTGTPIRSFDGIDRDAARDALGLPRDVPLVLVFGGSQAVRRLNDAVSAALPELVERVAVLHLTGESAYAAALKRREELPEDRRARYRPFPFLREEMGQAMVAADLLVGRAGSSTLAEAAAVGLPMVVVPYPHAAAHQQANARELVEAGAAEVIRRPGLRRRRAAARVRDPLRPEPRRERMGAASRRVGTTGRGGGDGRAADRPGGAPAAAGPGTNRTDGARERDGGLCHGASARVSVPSGRVGAG